MCYRAGASPGRSWNYSEHRTSHEFWLPVMIHALQKQALPQILGAVLYYGPKKAP